MDGSRTGSDQASGAYQNSKEWFKVLAEKGRSRYERSLAKHLVAGLNDVNFGDRIIIFGASLLLSVLPVVVILSAYANHRVETDISDHLGLSGRGARVIDGLFRTSKVTFNVGVLIGLLLSLAGTIAVARSVQAITQACCWAAGILVSHL